MSVVTVSREFGSAGDDCGELLRHTVGRTQAFDVVISTDKISARPTGRQTE